MIGSGASRPANYPNVDEISNQVLSGHGYEKNGHYRPRREDETCCVSQDQSVKRVVAFLAILGKEVGHYFSKYQISRKPNYEDYYYVVLQIFDSLMGEVENPAIEPLVEILESNLQENDWNFSYYVQEAQRYMIDTVACMLDKTPTSLQHMSFWGDACRDPTIDGCDLFSMNHDTLLEKYFSRDGQDVSFTDGFEPPVNNFRQWNPVLLEKPKHRCRLFKLHGSIDWFEFGHADGNPPCGVYGIRTGGFYYRPEDAEGNSLRRHGFDQPKILVGTFNKLWQYASPIFADLHTMFYRELPATERLIVVGYGFGDKGINSKLIQWMDSSSSRRMIVLDPQAETMSGARPAIRDRWRRWIGERRLKPITDGYQDVKWLEHVSGYL